MAKYLSEEWFEQVGAASGEAGTEGPQPALVLQHVISGGPGGEVCYHVRVSGDSVTIVRGRAARADATFSEDYATAAAIASGALNAPAALLAGHIRVGGDMATLIAQQGLLATSDLIPPAIRAATTY